MGYILLALFIVWLVAKAFSKAEDTSDLSHAQRRMVKRGKRSAASYRAQNAKWERHFREKRQEEILMKQAEKIADEIVKKQNQSKNDPAN